MIPEGFSDPLFKGCTRPAMVMGMPLPAFLVVVGASLIIGTLTTVLFNLLLIPIIAVMGQVTRTDDQMYRLLWLRFYFRVLHFNSNSRLWRSSTYAPFTHRGK